MENFTKKFIQAKKTQKFLDYFELKRYYRKSYSQEGEDMILRRIFEKQETGFYVDIGAHHPKRFSNTYFFYKKGWKGINIDAMPGSMKLFRRLRPRDINLELAIFNKKTVLDYYIFNRSALNGFSKELSEKRCKDDDNTKIIEIKRIQTKTLEEVLDRYLPSGQKIDFLSVDVESLDFEVLQSNNWKKYQPSYVLAEILSLNIENLKNNRMYVLLKNKGYDFYAKSFNTVIFKKSR